MIRIDRDIHPSVCTLRIDRPEKRNAINAEVATELTRELQAASEDATIRAIVITGTGKAFSAGADLAALADLAQATFRDNLADSRTLANLFECLYQIDKPVVARVNGHAIAGGCGLMAACDFAIVDDRAKFGFTEVRIGFVPAIISVYLVEKMPDATLRPLFLTGRLLTAAEALEAGMVHQVCEGSQLDGEVAALARELVRESSATAIAQTKRLLRARHADSHVPRLEAAIRLNAEARGSAECRAGVQAFLKKRPFPWSEEWDQAE